MEVIELYRLSEWFEGQYSNLQEKYTQLARVLKHNSTQTQQQPVEDLLKDLTHFLKRMPVEALSLQQLALLEKLGVEHLVGVKGARFVEESVKTTSYDPATAEIAIRTASDVLNQAAQRFSDYGTSIKQFGLAETSLQADTNHATIRIVFKSGASMNNVKDWKDYSKEWHDILRGVAMSAGETPEDVKVVGASNGSLIMVLAGTATVTTLLAVIAKNLTGISKNVISTKIAWEEYKQKAVVTETMEREHQKALKDQTDRGLRLAKEAAIEALPAPIDGDAKNNLESAVEKILGFATKGGEIDFVAPLESDEEEDNELMDAFASTRTAIAEFQEERQSVLLLENRVDEEEGG